MALSKNINHLGMDFANGYFKINSVRTFDVVKDGEKTYTAEVKLMKYTDETKTHPIDTYNHSFEGLEELQLNMGSIYELIKGLEEFSTATSV